MPIDPTRVLSIGVCITTKGWHTANFFDAKNIYESKLIVWDTATIIPEMARMGFDVEKPLSYASRIALENRLTGRLHLYKSWVERGHVLIVIVRVPLHIRYENPDRKLFNLWSLPLLSIASPVNISGAEINVVGPNNARDFLRTIANGKYYQGILQGTDLNPLLAVSTATPGPRQLVGGYAKLGDGLIIFVPPPNPDTGYDSDGEPRGYLDVLEMLPELISGERKPEPEWVESYLLRDEKKILTNIQNIEGSIQSLKTRLREESEKLTAQVDMKALFWGSGEEFSRAVAKGLNSLGFSVVVGEGNRVDLLLWDGTSLVAVEAKGLEGPARERNVRQCQQWRLDVLNALAANEEELKGSPELEQYKNLMDALGVPFGVENSPADCKGLLGV